MDASPERLLAQHARTTALLGVDAIPLGTAPVHAPAPHGENGGTARGPRSETSSRREAPVAEIEVKPTPKGARPEAPHGVDPVGVGPVEPVDLGAIRACHAALSDKGDKLGALLERYESDAPHERFGHTPIHTVFGEGAADAELMFVGEAPGQQEDETGRPFVGRAGQLLDKMIVAMGYTRESVYICNVLKVRPPGNATPTIEQAHASAPYLIEQIRIIEPRVIVTLGKPASNLLIGRDAPMRDMRGRFHAFPPSDAAPDSPMRGVDLSPCVVMPTYHPAYLLRSYTEENRRKVWSDLRMVVARLDESP